MVRPLSAWRLTQPLEVCAAGSASPLPADAVASMRAKALAAQRVPVAQQQQKAGQETVPSSEAPSHAPKRALEVSSAQPPAKRMELTPSVVPETAAAADGAHAHSCTLSHAGPTPICGSVAQRAKGL